MTYHIFSKVTDPYVTAEVEANSQEDAVAEYYKQNPDAPKGAVAYVKEFSY